MRLARLALSVCILVTAGTTLQAQTTHTLPADAHGCHPTAAAACHCGQCGGGGADSGLSASLHHALGYILPGGPGHDGRHKVYGAALRRNMFDKKYLLPVPYYSHVLPFYSRNRCCTGPNAVQPCPTCHLSPGAEHGVIEMHEMPNSPTPASPEMILEETAVPVPARETRSRPVQIRQATRQTRRSPKARPTPRAAIQDRVAQEDTQKSSPLGKFISVVLPNRADSAEKMAPAKVRQVDLQKPRKRPDPANPLR